jgi:hypothetical protein
LERVLKVILLTLVVPIEKCILAVSIILFFGCDRSSNWAPPPEPPEPTHSWITYLDGACNNVHVFYDQGYGSFNEYYNFTRIHLVSAVDAVFRFPGSDTGVFTVTDSAWVRLDDDENFECFAAQTNMWYCDSVVFKITRYDPAYGGLVEGEYSGKLYNNSSSPFLGKLYLDFAGKFSVYRHW